LFFFMTVTTMRETEFIIKDPTVPVAKTAKKIQDKNLVSAIYIGQSRDESIKGDLIQLNDKISNVSDVRAFILNSRASKSDDEVAMMTTLFKADEKTKVGTLADIKKELREIEALKIAYVAREDRSEKK
ncbi:MAG: biopolymer transporter ExbD, partial [Flavobacteriales bacterium]